MHRFFILATAIVFAIVAIVPAVHAGGGRTVVRVSVADRSDVVLAATVGEPWEVDLQQGFLILDVSPQEHQRLLELGFEVEIDGERTRAFNAPRKPLKGQVAGIPGFPCYRTVEETLATGAALAAAHPDLATWIDIGDSWEKTISGGPDGYDLMVLKLTNSAIAGDKPDLWVEGGLHAREYTTAETVTRFAEHLLAGYGVDPDITWLLDWHEIHLLLQTNPDGRKMAETGLSWRKNTDSDDGCGSASDWGTDLNRNFDFQWACCGGSSSDPCGATYHGPGAGSEPETQAVQSYVTNNFPDFRPDDLTTPAPDSTTGMFLDIHSYGGDVLSVFGFQDPPNPPNGPGILSLGRKLSYFNGYYARLGSVYPVDGSTKDWAYGRIGIPAFTIELGTDFFEPCSNFEATIWPDNLEMLLYAARMAAAPYLVPQGPDIVGFSVTPALVGPGDPVTIEATADDTLYGPGDGTMTTSTIAAAEVYVDVPPWASGAIALPLSSVDGVFDSTVEAVFGNLDTSGIPEGRHTLFVRARDASGVWGSVSAIFLWIQDPATAPHIAGVVTEQGTGLGLAATVVAGGFSTPTNPLSGSYDLVVTPGTYDVTATAPEHGVTTRSGVVAIDGSTTVVDFELKPMTTLLDDDVEAGNIAWTVDSAVPGGVNWSIVDDGPANHAWFSSDAETTKDDRLTAGPFAVDDGAVLTFNHHWQFEGSSTFWDGGVLEVSIDGVSWQDVLEGGGAFTAGGYTGTLSASTSNPLENRQAWTADSQGTVHTEVDLSSISQSDLWIRFRLGCDSSFGDVGWYVDDILLRTTLNGSLSIFSDGFESGDTSAWPLTLSAPAR